MKAFSQYCPPKWPSKQTKHCQRGDYSAVKPSQLTNPVPNCLCSFFPNADGASTQTGHRVLKTQHPACIWYFG